MKHKIVFFDVDGTITNYKDGTIAKSTKAAIRKLLDMGIQVVAATGRPLSMCDEIAKLGINTFITANGAYVKHNDIVIHKIVLNHEIVRAVMDYASKALNETLSLEEYPPENLAAYEEDTYLMCIFANEDMIHKYKIRFPQLTFKRWHPFILNVLEEDVSKSKAIIKVLEYFGLDKSEAVAFGDGENDMDMLEMVDVGIAMGNAGEKLKSIADFVTKESSEDGITIALKKYGFI